jgi:hypothetical protein
MNIEQNILDRAVNLATRAAMNGTPVKRVVWLPPQSATQNPSGNFLVEMCGPLMPSETPPWKRSP